MTSIMDIKQEEERSAGRPSPAEPVSKLRAVRIVECGEEMVDFMQFCPLLILDIPRFQYRRETLLRRTVAEKLCAAAHRLPKEYRFAMVEGWRPPHIQRRMYRAIWNRFAGLHPDWTETRLKRTVNRFSAPMDRRVSPPHTTGGAFDVMLADASGRLLDHTSPYEPFDPVCCAFNAPGLTPEARHVRDVMAEALLSVGITNYPSEFWHWSYGDQGWAYRGGHPHALYGAIEPPDWRPAPEDDVDTPLTFLTGTDAAAEASTQRKS